MRAPAAVRRRGRAALAGAVALASALAAAGPDAPGARAAAGRPAAAQAPEPGWLGIGLVSLPGCPGGGPRACPPILLVGGIVHGSPAERAGVQVGDTLIAVNGRELEEGVADPAFETLEPGEPAAVVVGRAGGRDTLTVVPRARPDSLAVLRIGRPPGERGSPYRLAVPAPPAVLDSLARAVAPGELPDGPVAVHVVDADRVQRIPFRAHLDVPSPPPAGAPARWKRALEGRSRDAARSRLRELRAERPEARMDARAEARMMEARAEELRRRAAAWMEWVDDALQPRLRGVYDSMLSRARARLESVARADAGGAGNRVAGAAFQPLTPGLTDFFRGAEEGLVVLRVLPGTPADRIGLRPGDVVVRVGERRVASLPRLRRALEDPAAGTVVEWIRKGERMSGALRR